ncbi:MAG TPA: replicative DNA helicase [Solirubrobacteraceae bacterium]|nr:replicative DNA helicase [Solirubrobacteraceae bacterium]
MAASAIEPQQAVGGSRGAFAPPHNLEAEESVLGAILLSDHALYALVVDDGLRPQHFYREQHRIVYQAMLDLYEDSTPVEVLTVVQRLRATSKLEEAGGEAALHALAGAAEAPGNARHYARMVRDDALLRGLLSATTEIRASVVEHQGPPRDLVERAERLMLDVAHDDRRKGFQKIDDILDVELDKLHKLSKEGTPLTGTRSGFAKLDELTGGFQAGNLIVIAARPSMGKSALVTNIAENAAMKDDVGVALFSLEMSETELAQRFIASQAGIKGEELRKGRVTESRWPKIVAACDRLANAPLYVDDSSDIGLLEIRAKARRLHQKNKLGLIIVDYLQLLRSEGRGLESRVELVGQMSRGLKLLARELDVPVIALSQLNRAVEARRPAIPMLSDLRESGSIEQDSDLVIFIYRDDYYNKEDSEEPGMADLIISKHRNGPLGNVKLVFRAEFPKFMTYQPEERAA